MMKMKFQKCAPTLPLDDVLRKWIDLNRKIAETWKDRHDVPWWYNERAAVSIFAGAVWKAGGFAFEEFADEKHQAPAKGRLERRFHGRVDLYANIKGKEFIFEAKQCSSGASSVGADRSKKIRARLDKAVDDARQIPAKGKKRLALLFVIPDVRLRHGAHPDDRIKHWLQMAKDAQWYNSDAMAYVFPKCARRTKWGKPGHVKHYYPGSMVLIKQA